MEWEADNSKTVTFVVTKSCQLACKYCYLVGKKDNEKMTWETAKQTVDFILRQYGTENFTSDAVIFDFIGGEPFLEIDLIDKICDYIKRRLYDINHPWFNLYRFSISTNGINYHTDKVQNFIQKNRKHLSIGFSIDGTKAKHDLNRIWKGDGIERGSYEDVVANVPLWLEQFPEAATKVTVSSDDIPYVCESVLHLFSLGIHHVNINCVFEDVWKENDDSLFEWQLKKLANEIVRQGLYPQYTCSFFDRNIGKPLDLSKDNNNWCGCGHMLAVDYKGQIYPCIRFLDFALKNKKPRSIGSIYSGIDKNKARPFYHLDRISQSPLKCLNCDIASGCSWCQGENYDSAELPSIFIRSISLCKMHKARVRANEYFWSLIDHQQNHRFVSDISILNSPDLQKGDKNVYFCKSEIKNFTILLSSDTPSICSYPSYVNKHEFIDKEKLHHVLETLNSNGLNITVIYPAKKIPKDISELLKKYPHKKILTHTYHNTIISLDNKVEAKSICLKFSDFYTSIDTIGNYLDSSRLDIYLCNYDEFDKNKYRQSLTILKNQVLYHWHNGHKVRVNLITDPYGLRVNKECSYGKWALFIAPNGKFYLCPAFYYKDRNINAIGTIENGWSIQSEHLLHREYSPICRNCSNHSCLRCIYDNFYRTLEYNIPSLEQCLRIDIEKEISMEFFKEL